MIKLYHSQQPIWWNTGNEIKPNQAALNKIQFEEATNFNVSWISETEINVIVPTNQTTTLIKITDDSSTPQDKYFYLVEVLNRTTENHECIYELDVWLTYLLPDLKRRQSIRTIRTLDVNTLKPTINIEPVGVPTGDIELENYDFQPVIEEGLARDKTNAKSPIPTQQPIPGITTNIYYVFKAKKPINYSTLDWIPGFTYLNKVPNYILVPLLNIQGFGLTKEYDVYYGANALHFKKKADVLNSYNNIQVLIDDNSQFGTQGVGEFIGIWVGPNYFRIKNKGIEVQMSDFGRSWNKTGIEVPPVPPQPLAASQDILVDCSPSANSNFKVFNKLQDNRGTFLALRVDSMPLSMTPLINTVDKSIFLKGLRYQENQDNHLILSADSIAFNEGFNYTNGVETTTINITVPIAYDAYYDMLNQQKHTLNTSLALAGVNSTVQGLSALTGLIPPEPRTRTSTRTETRDYQGPMYKTGVDKVRLTKPGKRGGEKNMGWKTEYHLQKPKLQKLSKTTNYSSTVSGGFGYGNIASGALGVVNAGIQFASTLAQQQAYRADLRTKISAAVLNVNDKYVSWYKIASKIIFPTIPDADTNTFISNLSYEVFSGPTTEPGIDYKFYGVDSQPQTISITDNLEAYLQIDNNTALSLQNDWGNVYTPIIKEAMLTLLEQGIRITGDKIK